MFNRKSSFAQNPHSVKNESPERLGTASEKVPPHLNPRQKELFDLPVRELHAVESAVVLLHLQGDVDVLEKIGVDRLRKPPQGQGRIGAGRPPAVHAQRELVAVPVSDRRDMAPVVTGARRVVVQVLRDQGCERRQKHLVGRPVKT